MSRPALGSFQRVAPGYYLSRCGRLYVCGTERAQSRDPRKVRKGRLWWNAGRVVNGQNEADDMTFAAFRDALARANQLLFALDTNPEPQP